MSERAQLRLPPGRSHPGPCTCRSSRPRSRAGMLRSSSFLKRTVCTPDSALTTVDLPCASVPDRARMLIHDAAEDDLRRELSPTTPGSSASRSCLAS